jgi:CheY-like chemotaxis protein
MTGLDRPTVLVVDDHRDNAEILRELLRSRAYPVLVASSGSEALAVFERERPSIVLLDVMMPGLGGWDVCRLMKSHPELGGSVRVIIVTGLDDWSDRQQALSAGADDYVEKPIDLSSLLSIVERNAAELRGVVPPRLGEPDGLAQAPGSAA